MGSLSTGGGSSAVAASAHAGCERFRHTDPMLTGMSRRSLSARLGHEDIAAGIPEARWMRAMTFETLVKDERFVAPLLTTAVGELRLRRPRDIIRIDAGVSVARTEQALQRAHDDAVDHGRCTLITSLALPFVGFEGEDATAVKPDFVVVTPRYSDDPATPAELDAVEHAARVDDDPDDAPRPVGSWLVLGDAKDYERVRSRIDDGRMLKGFLQVALGAESAAAWTQRPANMVVHSYGALAVPRNSFLQPTAVLERLDDHRDEVRARIAEREALRAELPADVVPETELADWVAHRRKEFDPTTCSTCSLLSYCRHELRESTDPTDLLVEIGIPVDHRPQLRALLTDAAIPERVPARLVAALQATTTGRAVRTGAGRIDPVGEPGTVELVLAKSDSSALGIHGLRVRRIAADGTPVDMGSFVTTTPQDPHTRLRAMHLLGEALGAAMQDQHALTDGEPGPVHLVVPDRPTVDLLVSIADSLAGVETSRLRWQHDLEQGRQPLTFDGNPATVPDPLTAAQRLAVSFLLEEDRSRALVGRSTTVIMRDVIARHVVPGGPLGDAGRLDHLLVWASAGVPLDHRDVSDDIAARAETPGARLSRDRSDELFALFSTMRSHRDVAAEMLDPATPDQQQAIAERVDAAHAYRLLVDAELDVKAGLLEQGRIFLATLSDSPVRTEHRLNEASAQAVWRRRLALHASDLVRFGRTSRWWRNSQVAILESDAECTKRLDLVSDSGVAREAALNAGVRDVAPARVVQEEPLVLAVGSRRFASGADVVALHVNGEPSITAATPKHTKGKFKWTGLPVGALLGLDEVARQALPHLPAGWRAFEYEPATAARGVAPCTFALHDEIVLGDYAKFGGFANRKDIAVDRPTLDTSSAPKETCTKDSYDADPDAHAWCCKSHEQAEAEYSDFLADERESGRLNPQVWPPIVDADAFDIAEEALPQAEDEDVDGSARPVDLTPDHFGE